MNPYWDSHFFSFIYLFVTRLPQILLGNVSLAQDELQIFVLCTMSISCGLLGVLLVLRKATMLANSLSHTILLGIVCVFLFQQAQGNFLEMHLSGYIIAAFITAIITSFTSTFLNKVLKVQQDASIGIVFTTLFSIGIILLTWFSPNAHIGAEIVMGNIDMLKIIDIKWLSLIALFNIGCIIFFYKYYLLITFDSQMAKVMKVAIGFFNFLFLLQLSTTVIGAFRVVGVVLVLAYIVGPFLIARLFIHQYNKLLWAAPLIGCAVSILSVAVARHILSAYTMAISTAGLCVTLLGCTYFLALFFKHWMNKKVYAN